MVSSETICVGKTPLPKKKNKQCYHCFFIDRLCRLLSIFRPGQDAKLIVFFFKINKKEYEAVQKPPPPIFTRLSRGHLTPNPSPPPHENTIQKTQIWYWGTLLLPTSLKISLF